MQGRIASCDMALSGQPKWYNGFRMQEKCRYRGLRFSKFPGGACPDPLAARAFGARFFTLNILTQRTPVDETQLRA